MGGAQRDARAWSGSLTGRRAPDRPQLLLCGSLVGGSLVSGHWWGVTGGGSLVGGRFPHGASLLGAACS